MGAIGGQSVSPTVTRTRSSYIDTPAPRKQQRPCGPEQHCRNCCETQPASAAADWRGAVASHVVERLHWRLRRRCVATGAVQEFGEPRVVRREILVHILPQCAIEVHEAELQVVPQATVGVRQVLAQCKMVIEWRRGDVQEEGDAAEELLAVGEQMVHAQDEELPPIERREPPLELVGVETAVSATHNGQHSCGD